MEQTKSNNVNIIGSSGGALVAINVALERPDLVNAIIADSFEGEEPLEAFVANVIEECKVQIRTHSSSTEKNYINSRRSKAYSRS